MNTVTITSKRNYHPLIKILYLNGLLHPKHIKNIPNRTLQNWKNTNDSNYFGSDWIETIINEITEIKPIIESKINYSSTRLLNEFKSSFSEIVGNKLTNKKQLRKHAKTIVNSINRIKKNDWIKDIKSICWIYGVTPKWYYKQKNKIHCNTSPLGKCITQYPNQLTLEEVNYIELIMNNKANYGRSIVTLHHEAMRKDILYFSRTTFYKYANLLGYKRLLRYKPKPTKGFRAKAIFEYLHVDVTYIYTEISGIQKVAFVKDNFSKAILHYKSMVGNVGSDFITNLLKETFDKYDLYNRENTINIVSDGGSENKGEVIRWVQGIKLPACVKKLTAHTPEFPHSNNMSESTHHIYKNIYMKGKLSHNYKQHIKDIESFIYDYNYNRFPAELYSFSPMEVIAGKMPDKNRYKYEIEQAKKNRIKANQNYNMCFGKMSFNTENKTFC